MFLKLSQISKNFSDVLIKKNMHISGPGQVKPLIQGSTVY